jgi:flagellar biosynthesis/type III secretory pathway protein FliH
MTNEQILELAKTCGFDSFTGEIENFWECWEEQLLKFALAIHEDGYNKGYDRGYEEGYESSIVSSRMNTREEE